MAECGLVGVHGRRKWRRGKRPAAPAGDLLERDFTGLGFRSRLRRVNPDGSGEETLLTTSTGTHDNLEGLDVWADGEGLRATMISDDNRYFFQETQFVDYRLPD